MRELFANNMTISSPHPQHHPQHQHFSVSAVVVTWNSLKDIDRCLDSLLNQTHPLKRIIVVDNASSDD
ncbi:MAG: glycosyltransferase, partial [Calditrichota bacterium]